MNNHSHARNVQHGSCALKKKNHLNEERKLLIYVRFIVIKVYFRPVIGILN